MSILGYINVVVVVDERVMADRIVESDRRDNKDKRQNPGWGLVPNKYPGFRRRLKSLATPLLRLRPS
jgi:hypothetical protein